MSSRKGPDEETICAVDGPGYGSLDDGNNNSLEACSMTQEEQDEVRRRAVFFACFLCLVAVGEGYDIGVLNGAAVRVKEVFSCSTLEISLIVSATPICVMPGSILGGALADCVGRWRATVATCVVLTIGPIAMALSQSVPMLICTRGIVGLGIGMGLTVVGVYIAEVAPTAIRGRLTALTGVAINTGILTGYFVNWWLLGTQDDWRWMLGLGAVLPFVLVFLLCLPQMDESPRWLFVQGREDEAEEVLSHYVGAKQAAADMTAMRQQAKQAAAETGESLVTWGELFRAFGTPGSVRRMLLVCILVIASQLLCGYLPLAYYSSTLLKDSAGERTAFLATIAMGVVKLTVAIVTVLVLDRFGRRPMLLASGCITALACLWLAVTFRLRTHWVWQAFGFMLFMAGYELGLGPVAFVYIAEVCSTAWRAKSSSFAIFTSRFVGSAHLFGFPLAVEAFGTSNTFFAQSALGVIITVAMWFMVTETKGRSLERLGANLFAD